MRRINKKGFTLIEMVISVSIMVIVFAMLITIFKATQESFTSASALQAVINTSRSIISRMNDEISAAFFDPQGRISLLGLDASGPRFKTDSAGDELYFCIPIIDLNESDITEIGYWVRTDGNLMRHYQENADYDYQTATADDELGLIINSLDFSYFDGTQYQSTWDSRVGMAEEGKAPKAVKVMFSVSDSSNMVTKQFETIVHIPSGKRY